MGFQSFRSFRIEEGLTVEERKGAACYYARFFVDGKKAVWNTQTAKFDVAVKRAKAELATRRKVAEATQRHTMAQAYDLVLKHRYAHPDRAKAKEDFTKRWKAIKDVHGLADMDVTDVTAKWLWSFAEVRKAAGIKGSTQRKDWVTIGPILRQAQDEGWIEHMPNLPKADPSTPAYNRPFKLREWKLIRQEAKRRIKEATTDADRANAQEVYDHMVVMVYGLIRPDEVRRLHRSHIIEDEDGMTLMFERKTGEPMAEIPVRFETLEKALKRRRAVAKANPERGGYLFHRDEHFFGEHFRPILKALGLDTYADPRKPDEVVERTGWSLRPTGICLEIQRQRAAKGAPDYREIAQWAGTSMARIDGHYAKFLETERARTKVPSSLTDVLPTPAPAVTAPATFKVTTHDANAPRTLPASALRTSQNS